MNYIHIADWRKKKGAKTVEMDAKKWHWCPHHKKVDDSSTTESFGYKHKLILPDAMKTVMTSKLNDSGAEFCKLLDEAKELSLDFSFARSMKTLYQDSLGGHFILAVLSY